MNLCSLFSSPWNNIPKKEYPEDKYSSPWGLPMSSFEYRHVKIPETVKKYNEDMTKIANDMKIFKRDEDIKSIVKEEMKDLLLKMADATTSGYMTENERLGKELKDLQEQAKSYRNQISFLKMSKDVSWQGYELQNESLKKEVSAYQAKILELQQLDLINRKEITGLRALVKRNEIELSRRQL